MRRLAFLFAACLAGHAAEFEYHGFRLGQTIGELRSRFPRSTHEVNEGSGRYELRLQGIERAGAITYVAAETRGGAVVSLRLSLEAPGGGSFERRHPACKSELAELTRRYGEPAAPAITREERLKSLTYRWQRPAEELSLVCGQYDERRTSFAMDVLLRQSGR